MANITQESEEIVGEQEIFKFLDKYGKVEICKPIKNTQGKLIAKDSYIVYLFTNSSLNDKKFIDFCKKHRILINLDIFSEW